MKKKFNKIDKSKFNKKIQDELNNFLDKGGDLKYIKNNKSNQERANRIKTIVESNKKIFDAKNSLDSLLKNKTTKEEK